MLSHNVVMLQVIVPARDVVRCTKQQQQQQQQQQVLPTATMIRRVHFSADENDSQSAPHKEELTSEMVQDMWYTPTEMNGFKEDAAKSIIIRQRRNRRPQELSDDDDEDALGLERYYEPKRDEFRRAAIFYTLQAQTKSRGDPNFIRLIARKCSDFARAAAVHQGRKDFDAAYKNKNNNNNKNNNTNTSNNDSSLDTQGKRQRNGFVCCTTDAEEPSAKKQRTLCVA